MPSACIHPSADDVGRLLTSLLGRRVAAKRGTQTKAPIAFASYVASDGTAAAALISDLEFANYVGAALPMLPNAIANEAIRQKRIDPEMFDNVREVANIITGLFNGGSARLSLRDVARMTPPPPADVAAIIARPARRLDLDVDITGYGVGRISLLFAAPPLH